MVRQHLGEAPALEFRYRTSLLDADLVPDRGFALLVMRVELLGTLDDLLELRVGHARDKLHHDGFVHLGRDHNADSLLVEAFLLGGGFRHESIWVRVGFSPWPAFCAR